MDIREPTSLNWLAALIAIIGFVFPIILADEVSLYVIWLFTFGSWLVLVIWAALYKVSSHKDN